MMSEPAIQVDDLCKSYGPVLAVDHVHFQVAPGELVGFLGPNGAGKSTTMRILTTFLPASSGVARILGYDVMADSMEVRQRIGYLPESVPIYPEMRVEEYLTYRAKLKGVERDVRQRRIGYCLERCRIREVRRRLIGTLSKGYRQRVGLADTMLADPPVLILDEPTSGLDPLQIRETLNTIKELAGTHTVLLSTHILPEVEAICDRVIIINQGAIRWDGKLSELARQDPVLTLEVRGPADEVRALLQAEKGVRRVNARPVESGVTAFEVELDGKAELRETLPAKVIQKGWALRRLDLRRQKLEDLYMRVVLRAAEAPAIANV
jgi:gliding motility-associated transport system ATP-binding protein